MHHFTHDGGIVDLAREGQAIYVVDGQHFTSRELLRAYHPEGETVIEYAHHGWRGKEPHPPGFERELNHAVWLSGAIRFGPMPDDGDEE